MQKRLIHRMDVTINYLFHHSFHRLQIFHLRPALLHTPADLIYCIFHWSILWAIWWTTNNTVPALPHGLVHLRCLMRGKIVVYQSPAKCRIGNRVVCVEHMLHKRTICHSSSACLGGNTGPNTGPTHRAYNTAGTAGSPVSTANMIVNLKVPLS